MNTNREGIDFFPDVKGERYDENHVLGSREEGLQFAHQFSKYTGTEAKYVKWFLRNKKIPFTTLLEKAFAEKIKARYAIALNSGTSALLVALIASGVGKGDEVILPALCPAMDAFAVIQAGATPVFGDAGPDCFNMIQGEMKTRITSRTRAFIGVNLYGLPIEFGEKLSVFKKNGITVIEDSAQCVLGKDGEKIAGTRTDMGVFSLERTKHLPIGEGGMIVTNDELLALKVRKIAGLGYANLTAEAGRMVTTPETFQDPDYLRHDVIGYNFRMPEICAAVGLAQVENMEQLVAQRIAVAELYKEALQGCDWLLWQKYEKKRFVNSYYTLAVRKMRDDVGWKDFYNKYKEFGGDGFYAANMIAYKEPALKGYHGDCPIAEDLQKRLMLFKTNYRGLELAEIKAEALNKTWRYYG